jgi:Flp pilus assembly pilin Flp
MKKLGLLARIRKRFRDQSGQSTTEYILILAIVVMIASKMKDKLGKQVERGVDNVGNIIEKQTSEIGQEH